MILMSDWGTNFCAPTIGQTNVSIWRVGAQKFVPSPCK